MKLRKKKKSRNKQSFNDAVINSDNRASDDCIVVNFARSGKDVEGNGPVLI
jgi:hypothetical protein